MVCVCSLLLVHETLFMVFKKLKKEKGFKVFLLGGVVTSTARKLCSVFATAHGQWVGWS